MKLHRALHRALHSCRSPHGERGLKYRLRRFDDGIMEWSLSSWRAWIEIPQYARFGNVRPGRSPHGESGLKLHRALHRALHSCRSPHGERGLKYRLRRFDDGIMEWSLSSWRAWIEIPQYARFGNVRPGRSPHGESGLKSRTI